MTARLELWNQLPEEAAAAEVLPCCGSYQWARRLARLRPFVSETLLFETSDSIWLQLNQTDWNQAFASHPRIGESRHAATATARSADWSRQEQGDVALVGSEVQEQLKLGNSAYEQRFGRTYIVCATGKSAGQMLGILKQRLENDDEPELREAVEQQRQITQLRLRKWLQP